jgi:hypothetical protein
MQATIAYYEPAKRPAPGVRPDFTALPLAGQRVNVGDMRARPGWFSLDREGFTLVNAPSGVADFYDRGEVAATYAREVGALLRDLTGCTATAMLNNPVLRVSDGAGSARPQRPPGATFTGDFAHADFSAAAARQLLRQAVPPSEVPLRLASRYSVFTVWRTFSGPPQDVPLALCDARSVSPGRDKQYCSITAKTAGGVTASWENIAYFHSVEHSWWCCQDMTRDEAYVFRSFDSDPARAEQVPHSTFVNEACPPGAPPRASIEIRMFAFYD